MKRRIIILITSMLLLISCVNKLDEGNSRKSIFDCFWHSSVVIDDVVYIGCQNRPIRALNLYTGECLLMHKDTSCSHDTPECPSFILNGCYSICTDGNYLYECGKRNAYNNETKKLEVFKGIYKWDIETNSRSTITEWVDEGGFQSSCIRLYDGNVYYITMDSKNRRLIRSVNCNTKVEKDVYIIGNRNISAFDLDESYIYYIEDGKMYQFNRSNKSTTTLVDNCAGVFSIINSEVFYFELEEKSIPDTLAYTMGLTYKTLTLYKYDPQKKEKTKLIDNIYGRFFINDSKVYYCLYDPIYMMSVEDDGVNYDIYSMNSGRVHCYNINNGIDKVIMGIENGDIYNIYGATDNYVVGETTIFDKSKHTSASFFFMWSNDIIKLTPIDDSN